MPEWLEMEICPWPSSWVWQTFWSWVMGDVWMGRAPLPALPSQQPIIGLDYPHWPMGSSSPWPLFGSCIWMLYKVRDIIIPDWLLIPRHMDITRNHQESEESTLFFCFKHIFFYWKVNVSEDDNDNIVRGQDMVIRRLQPGIIPNYKSHGERAWGHIIIITSS